MPSVGSVPVRTDRLGSPPRWALPAAVIAAAVVGVHGIVHGLPDSGGQHHLWTRGVLLTLWGLTTVLVLGGLAALGWAYSRLASDLQNVPRIDLDILPADERTVLEPVIESPGVTQAEVVDRSDYSDAKVSQTLKALRERGLVYREPQGRTYRLYPGSVLERVSDAA